jgi:hypothetical protein
MFDGCLTIVTLVVNKSFSYRIGFLIGVACGGKLG